MRHLPIRVGEISRDAVVSRYLNSYNVRGAPVRGSMPKPNDRHHSPGVAGSRTFAFTATISTLLPLPPLPLLPLALLPCLMPRLHIAPSAQRPRRRKDRWPSDSIMADLRAGKQPFGQSNPSERLLALQAFLVIWGECKACLGVSRCTKKLADTETAVT